MALGLAAGASNFAAALPLQMYDQERLAQQRQERLAQHREDRTGAQSEYNVPGETQSNRQVVTTRADQNIYQQYGRDSVYGFSPDRKPLTPEQTAARSAEGTTYVD